MRAWAVAAVVFAAAIPAFAASPAFADECDSEVRSVENEMRALGNQDATLANRVNRAQLLCRDSPVAGRAELESVRRQLDQQAARPEPFPSQPPPLGQPWTGAGPGGAVNRY